MKFCLEKFFFGLVWVGLSFQTSDGFAAADLAPRNATATAKWMINKKPALLIQISDLLTQAQREIVHSGFSTFTLLAIDRAKIVSQEKLPEFRIVCSIKYDTWEEKYQLIRVDPAPVESSVEKDYKSWSDKCLTYSIHDPELLNSLPNGGTLYGIFQIRQSSPDEASKIKNWLVKQQSGFMQGLYSHMLGDFQFRGTVQLQINVPPMPTPSPGGDTSMKSTPPKKGG